MPPKAKTVEQKSQATPFAQKFLEQMMASARTGFATPLQRNVGASFTDLLTADQFDNSEQFDALKEIFDIEKSQGNANIRESFSIGGNRNSTAVAVGQGRFTAESDARNNAILANIASKSFESAKNRELAGTQAAGQFSNEAFMHFLTLALSGIFPELTQFSENPFLSAAKGVAGLATGVGDFITGLNTQSEPDFSAGGNDFGSGGVRGLPFTPPQGRTN